MILRTKRSSVPMTARDQRNMIGERLSFASAEAYKLLRANLMFSLPDEKKCRIIGITSAIRGEGKTTTSINLAYTLAEAGKKVLLLEADMRLPNIAKRLDIARTPGLSNLLVGFNSGAEIIQKFGRQDNMCVITAGEVPPNPSELLSSDKMEVAMNALAKDFEFILLDLPPVTAVSDALVVSNLINGMIITVRQDYSNQRALAETMRQLKFMDVKTLGFVLTQAHSQEKSYKKYRKYIKKYGYGLTYGYGYDDVPQRKHGTAASSANKGSND